MMLTLVMLLMMVVAVVVVLVTTMTMTAEFRISCGGHGSYDFILTKSKTGGI